MADQRYCNVCGEKLSEPIYASPRQVSVTSNTEILNIPTQVYFCERCGHLNTSQLNNLESYYDTQYNILIESDDEDQLYQLVDGQKVFRADFQLDTLLEKQVVPQGAKVLDFGSGKGMTLRRLALRRPDITYALFEVSEAYIPFWQKFAVSDQWATYRLPETWNEQFDLVISFYVLEHVAELAGVLQGVSRVLKPDGIFYFVVPNVYANTGDFVVVDHVNHFSEESLRYLMEMHGLSVIEIDAKTHDSAFVVTAKKMPSKNRSLVDVSRLIQPVHQMSAYWGDVVQRVSRFDAEHADEPSAIYGAGFYGTYLATCLQDLARVECFIDQNPHKTNQQMLGKPIIAPNDLPPDIKTIYVGLNPRKAKAAIEGISAWSGRDHAYFFL